LLGPNKVDLWLLKVRDFKSNDSERWRTVYRHSYYVIGGCGVVRAGVPVWWKMVNAAEAKPRPRAELKLWRKGEGERAENLVAE
jgi:hypothetical protein